jgi:hypothetical protein
MTDHPIPPPPELLKQWEDDWFDEREHADVLLIQAFQAGADQELEACCEYLVRCAQWEPEDANELRAARRPKPPSLKRQALEAQQRLTTGAWRAEDWQLISRALEALPE